MLTEKQQKVFDYIVMYIQKYHRSPKYRDITKSLWYKSTRNIGQYIEILESKWLIQRPYWKISLMNTREHTIEIPVLWVANAWMPLRVRGEYIR